MIEFLSDEDEKKRQKEKDRAREISGCWEGLWAFPCEDKACSGRGAVRGAESAAGSSGPLYLRRRRAFSWLLSVFISCTPLVASPRLSPVKHPRMLACFGTAPVDTEMSTHSGV